MSELCPFFKDECHGNQCKMWKDEECLIVKFLRGFQSATTEEPEEGINLETGTPVRANPPVPKWLKTATAESIAKDILEFKDEQFPNGNDDNSFGFGMSSSITRLFWSKKGVQTYWLPPEIQCKIEQADMMVNIQIRKEEDDKRRQRLSTEKEELPSLVGQCADWARLNDLKKLTQGEVESFVQEKELDLLHETIRLLWIRVNLALKTGRA